MLLWLYLHFPTLQLDTLFAGHREENDTSSEPTSEEEALAVAIVDGRKHEVVQANACALEQGVTLGMGLGSAAALCQDLQVHPYDNDVETRRLHDIAQWLYMITSDICLCPPNGLLIKVTNMLSLYEGIGNYWATLQAHLKHLNVQAYYSTGVSPYSAMLMAKQGRNWIESDRKALNDAVARYSLTCSELPNKQVEKLQRVGIQTIADLLALPLPDIAKRFDIDLVNYVGRLTGQFKHPVDFYHPPEHFCQYLELLFDVENIDWLQKPLRRLLNQLEVFLKLRDKVAFELSLILHQRDHGDKSVSFHSAQGDYLAEKWQTLSALTLESIKLDGPVNGLTLEIVRADEVQVNEHDLFSGVKGSQTALELISTLQAKLGQNNVTSLTLTDDPRPEFATQPRVPTANEKPEVNAHLPHKLRPSLLYSPPFALEQKVTVALGPERIVSGWWDGNPVKRDYYVARGEQGQWLWIYRTEDKQWFIHGQFS
ncbi:DNA polymerase Y family protein [Vibrio sp. SCSIO 43140]|uniref:Y-family DNA polymerase n=1 Tax=Vibrio sp. SCSIO 43140 TaxID=2819100 RepID=UPI002075B751|nr:DNA polymerase Y family protein [Vibrio sp. SCSIO 43140]USD59424.1 DNA polymerase Y family protein [Vibrio sp. SCSIO 43140]